MAGIQKSKAQLRQKFQILAERLNDYGLNPLEWKIEPISSAKCRIFQDGNSDFEFEGEITRWLGWKNLELKANFA